MTFLRYFNIIHRPGMDIGGITYDTVRLLPLVWFCIPELISRRKKMLSSILERTYLLWILSAGRTVTSITRYVCMYAGMYWRYVRVAEWSKAPDSRYWTSMVDSELLVIPATISTTIGLIETNSVSLIPYTTSRVCIAKISSIKNKKVLLLMYQCLNLMFLFIRKAYEP